MVNIMNQCRKDYGKYRQRIRCNTVREVMHVGRPFAFLNPLDFFWAQVRCHDAFQQLADAHCDMACMLKVVEGIVTVGGRNYPYIFAQLGYDLMIDFHPWFPSHGSGCLGIKCGHGDDFFDFVQAGRPLGRVVYKRLTTPFYTKGLSFDKLTKDTWCELIRRQQRMLAG